MAKEIRLTRQVIAAVTKVTKYINEHPLEDKTTTDLAELAGISRNLLQKAFKMITGKHIKEYYISRRMIAAMELIEEGMAIRQVARLCKYQSHSAFTTAFKNKFGISPIVWGKQKSQNK